MPELSVPFVNQVSAQRNAEQQAQQQQQIMQMAHWSLIAKQRQEAEQDREFKSLVGIAADGDFPDDMRLQAINKVGPKLGLPGQVTIDGLRPMSTLLSKMQKTHEAGGDLSVFQPAIDMISANIRLISPSQLPQFADLASQANEARVNKAVDFSNPVTPDVQEAMDRVEGRKADLTDLRSQADRYQANAANGASPTVQREAVGMLDQLRQMEDDDVRDQTIIKGDTVRQTRNQQIATMVRRDPKLLAEIEKNGLAKAGVVPFDANGLASQYYALASKEPDTLTPPEQRKLVVLESLGVAKGLKDRTTAVAASALTAQWQQAKVDADGLGQTITADHEAQETANGFTPALEDIITRGKTGPLDETSWNRLHQDAKTQSEAMGTAKLQAVQAAAPKVQALTEEYQTLSQQEKALREQAAMVPASRRAELLAKADRLARLMDAKQAESALLTTAHPLEKQEHEWTLKLHEMNVEQLKAALQSENLSPEKRAELQKEYDASNATADTERKFLDGWETKRQRALLIVNKTQIQLQKEADALKARATTLNASLEKEEQTNLLTRSILTDLGDGKTLTQSLSENKNSFGSADIKKVIEDVKTLTAMDESRAIGTAQDAFAALVAGHKGELTQQVEAGYAQKAAAIAKKQTGVAVKIEDVLKGLPRQAGVTINVDTRKFTPEQSGRVSAMSQALNEITQVRDLLVKPDGSVDRTTLFSSNLFGGLPFTKGRDVNRYIQDAIETKLRLETGAAAQKDEVKRIADRFRPANGDSDATILGKLDMFERFIRGAFNVLDPSGEVRGRMNDNTVGPAPRPTMKSLSPKKQQMFQELQQKNPNEDPNDIMKFLSTVPD